MIQPTSDYIALIRHFTHTPSKHIVYAYVEGNDDIAFWTYALRTFGNTSKYEFRITTNKKAEATFQQKHRSSAQASEGDVEAPNGKGVILSMAGLGENKIVCVDADMDLIVDNYSQWTNVVRNGAFIITTTYYSVENVLSSPQFIEGLISKLGLPLSEARQYTTDLENLGMSCSRLISYGMNYKSHSVGTYFTMVAKILNSWKTSISVPAQIQRIDKIIGNLNNVEEASLSSNSNRLTATGYKDKDRWALIRGHNLYTGFVRPWIISRINKLWSQKISLFVDSYNGDSKNKSSAIKDYKKQLFSGLGTFRNFFDAIDNQFYSNDNVHPAWLPKHTKDKIVNLFS